MDRLTMGITNITDKERQLQADVEELIHENALLRARNQRLKREFKQAMTAISALVDEPQPLGIERPSYREALELIDAYE
jgi:regulator of replication initiation timing